MNMSLSCPLRGASLGGNWGANKLSCCLIHCLRQIQAPRSHGGRCWPRSCSNRACAQNTSGKLHCLLAVPGQCFSRTPGGIGGSRFAAMKESQTLHCFILCSKTSRLGDIDVLRPSSFSHCPSLLSWRAEAGTSAGMLHILHVCQTYSSIFGQGVCAGH